MTAKIIAVSVVSMFLCMAGAVCLADSNSQQIVTAPNADEPKGSLYFDMGHAKMPVWPGFTQVSVDSLYKPEVGYGWVHNNPGGRGEGGENLVNRVMSLNKYSKSNPILYPDDLVGDYVFWRGGAKPLTFRVDIPDGNYRVWIYSGMFQGTIIYDRASFEIKVNGFTKYTVQMTRDDFLKRFYQEAGDEFEWRPGHDIWTKYVKEQAAKIIAFPATVTNGTLLVEFCQSTNSWKNAVIPINAIIICPGDETARMEKKIELIEAQRRRQFIERWKANCFLFEEKNVLPEISKKYRKAGAVPFVRNMMETIYPNSIPRPDEIGAPIDVALAQGQRELACFAIHPLEDLENVTVTLEPLKTKDGRQIAPEKMEFFWVRYLEQPLEYRRHDCRYRPVPMPMMKNKPLNIPKEFNRQWALVVKAAPDTAPGTYEGGVTVSSRNHPELVIPLKVTVYPFALETYPDDDERIWIYYGGNVLKAYGKSIQSDEEYWQWVDRDLAFMKEHEIAPTILTGYLDNTLDDFRQFMKLYMKYGFRGYATFRGGELVALLDDYGIKPYEIDYKPLIRRFKEICEMSKKESWPPPIFMFTGELHTGMLAYQEAKRAMELFKKEIPGVKLLVLPSANAECEIMISTPADVIGPNAVSLTADNIAKIRAAGKKLWQYCWGRERFRCGFNDWRLGDRGSLREWYSNIKMAPFNPFDGPTHDMSNDAPPLYGPDGIVSTLQMEETTAGRIDFMYLATLDLWLERARAKGIKTSDAVRNADALIAELQERIEPEYTYYYDRQKQMGCKENVFNVDKEKLFKWKNSEYELYRRKAANCVVALKKAIDDKK